MTDATQSFQRRKEFLSLNAQDEQAIRDLHEGLSGEAHGFVDGFYRHLLSFDEMRALIPDDAALQRLKGLHVRYFRSLTAGIYDEAYGKGRQHVGLAHAQVGLAPGWYLGGYSHYLVELLPRLARLPGLRHADPTAVTQALIKVVFLDIGLTIDSYIAQRDGLIADLREREQLTRDLLDAQQRLEKLALYDTLTGLPNRAHGMAQAQRLLDAARQRGQRAAVLFVDLDRFKEINDTRGHAVGDQVLVAVARQCQRVLGSRGTLARLGGDEFMFTWVLTDGEAPLTLARRICGMLCRPMAVGDLRFEVGASTGVAVSPQHGDAVDELLQHADIAMYRAKAQGGGHSQLYDDGMGRQLQRRIALGARLEKALAEERLQLHYQPKLALASGALCGVEALARWHDAEWGWVSPAEFIPVAEERGLIAALGDWSLAAAARQWRAWRDAGVVQPPVIAVNVSAAQMMSEAFAEHALAIVQAHGVGPTAIELEITESALMHDPAKARRVASRLVEMGFTLSIDDFGTGYSSLARLQSFPVSRLKIDMSFVRGMLTDPGSLAIVTAVIGLAHALQLRTVAEGVETQSQKDKLHALQCDEAQGYLFAQAVPAADIERNWLAR
ncbi:MAG: EAL domain-containing protein [Acidovorax sp.]|uniref:putative bifunctional diguanylate cyclase/phosphodiesterase n=1 Tax=Acidovorax sp. TaxID=1872122 RepID=UPI0039E6FFB3